MAAITRKLELAESDLRMVAQPGLNKGKSSAVPKCLLIAITVVSEAQATLPSG